MPTPQPLGRRDPRQVGPYQVTALIGWGGQGRVYLATAPDHRQVAVKVLDVQFDRDAHAARQAFMREADAARKVADLTARVLDVGIDDDLPYIVSEYIDGQSLHDVVAKDGPRDPGAVRRIAINTAAALAAIHTAGLVHCDFKPGNVLMGPDGPRVIDFGIARALDTLQPHTSRQIGTPAYMAPEQITEGTVSPATDMFAWALTLTYATTGTPAFGTPTTADRYGHAVLYRIVNDPPDLSRIPPPLHDLIAAALAKHPDQRPTALEAFHALIGGTPHPAATLHHDTRPDPTPRRTRSVLPFGAPIGPPLTGHTGHVFSVACGMLDGRPIAVTGGRDGTARVWDLTTGQQIGLPLTGHTGTVWSVACGELDGRPIAATGSADETVRVWDLTTGRQIGPPLGHTTAVFSVACGMLDGRPIAVTGGRDGTARVWDLTTGRQIGLPLTGRTGTVWSVACGELDARPIAVTGSGDGTARVWDLTTRQQIGLPLTAHTEQVWSVACGELDGRPIAATASRDGTARVWDLTTCQQIGLPLTGHTRPVFSVVCGTLDGRPIAATASADMTARVWDLTTRQQIGLPLTGHTGTVRSVACGELDGQPIAVTGSNDGTVRVWSIGPRPPG